MCFELNRYDIMPLATFILLLMLIQFCFWILHFAEATKCPPEGVDKSQQRTICLARVNLPKQPLKLSKRAPKRRKTFSKAIFFVALCESVFWLFDNYDSQSPRGALRWHFRLTKTTPNNLFWIYIWQNSLSSPNKTATYSSSSFAN